MQTRVITDVDDLHDDVANITTDIDPTMATCYGSQRSALNEYQPRRRLWLPKKWGSTKQVLALQNNGQLIVDALLNSFVTIDRSAETSSTSGTLTNENIIKSNGNSNRSLGEWNTPPSDSSGEKVSDEYDTTKSVLPPHALISEIPDSALPANDAIATTASTKHATKPRCFPVNVHLMLPQKIYQVVNLDSTQLSATRDIPDDRSVHSLDTISTITMDPVLQFHRLSQDDDVVVVKKSSGDFKSLRRQQNYHKVKRLPLLQSFGSSGLEYDLLMWTNEHNSRAWSYLSTGTE
jgi:hypothetical protein